LLSCMSSPLMVVMGNSFVTLGVQPWYSTVMYGLPRTCQGGKRGGLEGGGQRGRGRAVFGFVCESSVCASCVYVCASSLCVSLCVSFIIDVRVVRGRRGCRPGGSCRSS
jgi:hypothetical protein